MLAKILRHDYGFRVAVCYSLDERGMIDPNNRRSVTGLAALRRADLLVLFTRFRDLPPEQFQLFLDYLDRGGPIVGFRTATHAFQFDRDKEKNRLWGPGGEKIADLLGQHWITHHGHHGDNQQRLTAVTLIEEHAGHPILRGVQPFEAYSWLYHVEGGGDRLHGDDVTRLLNGRSLISSHQMAGRTDRYPLTNPVAWTKTYAGPGEKRVRVFFTTLGHPFDFKEPAMRKLALNGILWALGREKQIPADGARAEPVEPYEPNNSGFGQVFKPNRRPELLPESAAKP